MDVITVGLRVVSQCPPFTICNILFCQVMLNLLQRTPCKFYSVELISNKVIGQILHQMFFKKCLYLNDQIVTQVVNFLQCLIKKLNPRVNIYALQQKNSKYLGNFLTLQRSFYLSVESPPSHPLNILKQFFLHIVW